VADGNCPDTEGADGGEGASCADAAAAGLAGAAGTIQGPGGEADHSGVGEVEECDEREGSAGAGLDAAVEGGERGGDGGEPGGTGAGEEIGRGTGTGNREQWRGDKGTGDRGEGTRDQGTGRDRVKALEEFAGGEVFDETAVGGEEFVGGEFFEFDPFELVENLVFEFAFEGRDCVELEIDCTTVPVVVADVGDVGSDGRADTEFFVEFAGEGLLGAFAVLDFSARKFPLQSHGLVRAALTDQDEAVAHDQSSHDEAKGGPRRTRVGDRLRVFHASSVNAQ